MTINELKDLAFELKFKGYRCVRIKEQDDGYVNIQIRFPTLDSEDINKKIYVGCDCYYKKEELDRLDKGSFINWIRESLTGLAMHEVSELFTVEGKSIFHPHKTPWLYEEDCLEEKEAA